MHSILSLEERADKLFTDFDEIKIYLVTCFEIFTILNQNPAENVKLLQETRDWYAYWLAELERVHTELAGVVEKLEKRECN